MTPSPFPSAVPSSLGGRAFTGPSLQKPSQTETGFKGPPPESPSQNVLGTGAMPAGLGFNATSTIGLGRRLL